MKSDLDELIELCETESQLLECSIKDNIEEEEYLNAHATSRALLKLSDQLRVLYKLRDPFYDEKMELERAIAMYENFNKKGNSSHLDSYYGKIIIEQKDRLQKLIDQKDRPLYDDQKIDNALFELLDGVHNGFILYLDVKNNLGFTFELSEINMLDISIGAEKALNIEYFFDGDGDKRESLLNKFKGLGFTLNYAGNKLVHKYDMKNFKDALSIKILLSRIIYDIFTYTELDNPASLVYF